MGRHAEGWHVRWKRGWAYCCFTWERDEYRIALRTQDKRKAQAEAARAYAEVVSGRRRPVKRIPGQLHDLEQLMELWIESKRPTLDERSVPMLEGYCRRFLDFFESLERITDASGADYITARLGQVLRTTVLRERSYLLEFLRWCKIRRVIAHVPDIARLPPKAQGKRSGPQRAKSVHITEDEAAQIISKLPEQSKTIAGRKWPLRLRFEFMWETALRPETISRLATPGNWRPGQKHLELENEDDKARYGREVDLTPRAVAILIAAAPEKGVIFGRHSYYKAIKRAAKEVLGHVRGAKFAPYDFRHGRAHHLLDAGAPIRGVSYVLGHKKVSTTDKYLAPDRNVGRRAIESVSRSNPDHSRTRKDVPSENQGE